MKKDINIKDMGKLGAISGIAGCMIAMSEKGDNKIPFPIWGGLVILIIFLRIKIFKCCIIFIF